MSQFLQQSDLFGESDLARLYVPESQSKILRESEIAYRDDFISEAEETNLLKAINAEPWMGDLKRRVQHYGYRYDYSEKTISREDRIGDLPDWVKPLTDRLVSVGLFESRPDQLIVNEYKPGQGIAPHIDRNCFGPVVAAVSLGSDCIMKLYPPKADETEALDFIVLRKSLMAYRGKGRYHYRHGIPLRKTDTQDGVKIPRDTRVSLTFRTVDP